MWRMSLPKSRGCLLRKYVMRKLLRERNGLIPWFLLTVTFAAGRGRTLLRCLALVNGRKAFEGALI